MLREKHGHLFVSHLLFLQLHMTNSNASSSAGFFVIHLIQSLLLFFPNHFLSDPVVFYQKQVHPSIQPPENLISLYICSTRASLGGNRCGSGT